MATTFLGKKNNAKTTITNNPLTAGGLSITLASSSGSKFPTGSFIATLWDDSAYPNNPTGDPNMELVLCDSRSGDTVTVNASGRGYGGTTGVEHATGTAFAILISKEHFDEIEGTINTLEDASVGAYTPPTAWTPTFTGFTAVVPTGNGWYMKIGKLVILSWYTDVAGTSNATTFTITNLPFTPVKGGSFPTGRNMDASAYQNIPARIEMTGGSATINIYKYLDGTVWTNSGSKFVDFVIMYYTA